MLAAEAGAVLTRSNRPKKHRPLRQIKVELPGTLKAPLGQAAVVDVDPRIVKRLIHDTTVGKNEG
ncbi:hypothetical protein [Brucella sp. NBRC 12950]|uniref:hypothetical protein n=1 Tax=Brucella sp. NBRC 12950 TaxID=2994518 RepID=UPI0024A59F7A|nr:hypothetical protein [Brucella sp. NBRC 12950]GLU30034.1 hypothetical protein Brsp01_52670 [Brucella sp. NBRC 12950]